MNGCTIFGPSLYDRVKPTLSDKELFKNFPPMFLKSSHLLLAYEIMPYMLCENFCRPFAVFCIFFVQEVFTSHYLVDMTMILPDGIVMFSSGVRTCGLQVRVNI
jgi:hypothetical protein